MSLSWIKISTAILLSLTFFVALSMGVDVWYPPVTKVSSTTLASPTTAKQPTEIAKGDLKQSSPPGSDAASPGDKNSIKTTQTQVLGSVQQGQVIAKKKCAACHNFSGSKAKIGPPLAGVFGRAKASATFAYSKALKAKGGIWDQTTLDAFLKNPRGYVKGTKMLFNGLKKDSDRQNAIAYLKTLQP